MSEQVQITMSVETYKLIHGIVMDTAKKAIEAVRMARMLGLIDDDTHTKALREIENLNVFMTHAPRSPKFVDTCPAPIYAFGIPSVEDSAEYQGMKRDVMAALAQAQGQPLPPLA